MGTHLSGDYVKIIVLCFIFGGGFIFQALRRQKRILQIEDTPKSKIASAPQGLVEVQGFAWPQEKGYTNSHGHELVYYQFSLERQESSGTGKTRRKKWVPIYTFVHAKPFYLLDPTGLAVVHPEVCEMEVEKGKARMWGSLTVQQQNYFLEKIIPKQLPNFPPKPGLFGLISSRYRVVEKEIRSGSPIYATGDFRTPNIPRKAIAHGLTYFAQRVIDFNSRAIKNLTGLLDKDANGKVCIKEAKDGYSFAAQLSQKKTTVEGIQEKEFEVFGEMKTTQNHILYLADAHEGHLVDKLKSGLYLRLLGGSALLAVGVVMTVRLFVSDAAIEQAMKIETQARQEQTQEKPYERAPASVPAKPSKF